MQMDYILRCIPEDFKVTELPKIQSGDGSYHIYKMRKVGTTTESAAQSICRALNIKRRDFGYAGTKDSNAIVVQYVSLRNVGPNIAETLTLPGLELTYIARSPAPLSLGDLEGNEFEITARKLRRSPEPLTEFINYYGEQRFSKDNAHVGKCIILKQFRLACETLIEHSGSEEKQLKEFLESHKNEYVGALKRLPWKILKMYVHAYQSHLWNKLAYHTATTQSSFRGEIEVIGFETEPDETINRLCEQEQITTRDFLIRQIPELSSPGTKRSLYASIHNLEISGPEPDELHQGEQKAIFKFRLGKGCYATEAIRQMMLDKSLVPKPLNNDLEQ